MHLLFIFDSCKIANFSEVAASLEDLKRSLRSPPSGYAQEELLFLCFLHYFCVFHRQSEHISLLENVFTLSVCNWQDALISQRIWLEPFGISSKRNAV